MPDFKSVENFHLILLFIVPGLVALYIRSKFITGRSPLPTENILSFVVLSLVYYSLTIFFIDSALTVREPLLLRAFVWILLILIGPALFGFVLGVAAQKEWGNWLAGRPQLAVLRVAPVEWGPWLADKLSLSVVHVIPAAWDWRFCTVPRAGMFILVTLSSGERVAGFSAATRLPHLI
jgi:hypothetical protein